MLLLEKITDCFETSFFFLVVGFGEMLYRRENVYPIKFIRLYNLWILTLSYGFHIKIELPIQYKAV